MAGINGEPQEESCIFCRADPFWRDGFQPQGCTGECKRRWRDPDAGYDRFRDDDGADNGGDWRL